MWQPVVDAVGLVTDLDATLRRSVGLGVREALVLAVVGCDDVTVDGHARVSDIAAAARVPVATASRALGRLEAAGLVARGPDAADGRVVHVALTRRGRAVRERVVAVISQAGASALKRRDGAVPDGPLMIGATPRSPLEDTP